MRRQLRRHFKMDKIWVRRAGQQTSKLPSVGMVRSAHVPQFGVDWGQAGSLSLFLATTQHLCHCNPVHP